MARSATIDLPDGIEKEALERAIRNLQSAAKKKLLLQQGFESTEAMQRYVDSIYDPRHFHVLWEPLKTYGESWRYIDMFVSSEAMASGDDRAPVFMRGSRAVCVKKYSLSTVGGDVANGWCLRILERYIKRYKITALDIHEFLARMEDVAHRLAQKHYTTYHFFNGFYLLCPRDDEALLWGETKRITKHQRSYIKKLRGLVKKYDSLEQRWTALSSSP